MSDFLNLTHSRARARVCVCPLLSLCSGMWLHSGEVAAMFYWWLLFQKPDQIEVGTDGFKQWDGKTSLKTASDHCLPSRVRNFQKKKIKKQKKKHLIFFSQPFYSKWTSFFCRFPFSLRSDHGSGHGGDDQHHQGVDGEPSEVRPFPWRQSLACQRHARRWGPDAHPDRGGLPAL